MAQIIFSEDKKTQLIDKLQRYFESELDYELGQFDADFLLDFISKEFGAVYYNQGVKDARDIIEQKVELIGESIYEIEQPES